MTSTKRQSFGSTPKIALKRIAEEKEFLLAEDIQSGTRDSLLSVLDHVAHLAKQDEKFLLRGPWAHDFAAAA